MFHTPPQSGKKFRTYSAADFGSASQVLEFLEPFVPEQHRDKYEIVLAGVGLAQLGLSYFKYKYGLQEPRHFRSHTSAPEAAVRAEPFPEAPTIKREVRWRPRTSRSTTDAALQRNKGNQRCRSKSRLRRRCLDRGSSGYASAR